MKQKLSTKESTRSTKSKTQNKTIELTDTGRDVEAKVLYQKIFNKWYAFSLVEDAFMIQEVPETQIEKKRQLSRKLST